jgi:hypothetical protein
VAHQAAKDLYRIKIGVTVVLVRLVGMVGIGIPAVLRLVLPVEVMFNRTHDAFSKNQRVCCSFCLICGLKEMLTSTPAKSETHLP